MSKQIVQEDIETAARGIGAEAHKFEGKTVLISGGSGFLGKYLIGTLCYLNDHILKVPCKIISVDNHITGMAHEHFDYKGRPDVHEAWADIVYPLPVREDIHYIIHAAGLASPVYYKKFPLQTIDSAVTGLRNLLNLGREQKNLEGVLFFSSSEIYGDPDPAFVPTPETYHGYVSSMGPRACYDESKRLGETIAIIYRQEFGIPTTIVRPFNVFGPGMGHADRRVLPMYAYKAINKEKIPVHGDGHQTRTFCYITDAVTGFFKALLVGARGQAYNIGSSDNEISMKNLAELFIRIEGSGGDYSLIPYPESYPADEPQRRCPDISKAKVDLDFTPKVTLEEGLHRFIEWCKNEPGYTGVATK